MRRNLIVITLGILVTLAVSVTAGGARPQPGFLPGTWVGSGVLKGILVTAGDPSPVDGTVNFTLNVSKSRHASGTITLKTRMEMDNFGLTGFVHSTATVPLKGSSTDLRFAGPIRLEGELTDGKITVPFGITKQVSGRLLITRAFCTKVVGGTDSQLSFKWTAVLKPGTPRPRCA
jgi:hypothetical protein